MERVTAFAYRSLLLTGVFIIAAAYAATTWAADGQAPRAQRDDTGRIHLVTPALFGFDSAELTDDAKVKLDALVDASQRSMQSRFNIVGYTDPIGSESYNEMLSRQRAEAVRDYLVDQGVPADRITIAAGGEDNLVAQCDDMSGEDRITCLRVNRRVEVEFAAFEDI